MKQQLGPVNALYPSLTALVGAMVLGKPNFITIAHVGIMSFREISISLGKGHYTNQGIKESSVFSVNIPNRALVEETDYCGLVSGKNTDKAELFHVFTGQEPNAPLIEECPLCMECRVVRVLDFERHDVFVGEVTNTHADPAVLTDGAVDLVKVDPLLFDILSKHYYAIGERLAPCWSAGKTLKAERILKES